MFAGHGRRERAVSAPQEHQKRREEAEKSALRGIGGEKELSVPQKGVEKGEKRPRKVNCGAWEKRMNCQCLERVSKRER